MNGRETVRDRTWHQGADRDAGIERVNSIFYVHHGNEGSAVGGRAANSHEAARGDT